MLADSNGNDLQPMQVTDPTSRLTNLGEVGKDSSNHLDKMDKPQAVGNESQGTGVAFPAVCDVPPLGVPQP